MNTHTPNCTKKPCLICQAKQLASLSSSNAYESIRQCQDVAVLEKAIDLAKDRQKSASIINLLSRRICQLSLHPEESAPWVWQCAHCGFEKRMTLRTRPNCACEGCRVNFPERYYWMPVLAPIESCTHE